MNSIAHASQRLVAPLILSSFLVLGLGLESNAQTLWTGPTTNFTQSASNLVDVLVPGAVSLTRAYSQWLYNPAGGDPGPGLGTPSDTEWAFGTLDNYASLYYETFDTYRNGDLSTLLVSNPMVVYLVNENIYLSVTFTAWPQHGGYFAYTRSTPAVSITSPTNGATYAAPATLNIKASAAVAGASVTNVSFYANGALIGSSQKAPYSVTNSGLAAGSYALTAVEWADGITETSAVVNMTVVTAVPIRLSSGALAGNQFSFAFSANPGLNYVIQTSSNLLNWLTLATNTATNTSVNFTDTNSATGSRFYRVARMPNP